MNTTETTASPGASPKPKPEKRTIVIVARHGERLDYYLRDKPADNSNFIPTAKRPWDPPLTERGRLQGRALGTYLASLIPELDVKVERLSAVYSSPFIRCCQTAAEAIVGYKQGLGGGDGCGTKDDLKVKVEPGVAESMNANWYKSWCLEGSNGTWGGPPNVVNTNDSKRDERSNHPVSSLLWGGKEVHSYFASYPKIDPRDDSIQHCHNPTNQAPYNDLPSLVSPSDEDFIFKYSSNDITGAGVGAGAGANGTITTTEQGKSCAFDYHWGNFESATSQQDRMHHVVESLAQKHEGETILVVSHGGPVTHLFERLMQKGWDKHGLATYACFSVYEKVTTTTLESKVKNNQLVEERKLHSWNALVVNESCHVEAMRLVSREESAKKVDFFE